MDVVPQPPARRGVGRAKRPFRRYVPKHRRRRKSTAAAMPALALLVVSVAVGATTTYGLAPVTAGAQVSADATESSGADATASRTGSNRSSAATDAATATSEVDTSALLPAFVNVPTIGATSRLIRLGLEPDGRLQVPEDFSVAGWYERGAAPGQPGPSIIAGHVDSYTGPGIFAKLDLLKAGDPIFVTRVDGAELEFTVTHVDQYPKDAFPTELVYADSDQPELRLITCGGTFDKKASSYRDNVVVYAVLASTDTSAAVKDATTPPAAPTTTPKPIGAP